jgi:predicted AlkP superfamily pyrophosphatase or phosphodiesterase
MRVRWLAVAAVAHFSFAPAARVMGADVELAVVGSAPARPHFVSAGTSTTFVVAARNASALPVAVSVSIDVSGPAGGWQASVSEADRLFRPVGTAAGQIELTVAPGGMTHLLARVAASPALGEGAESVSVVRAFAAGAPPASVELISRVRNRPKIYYIAIDGCGRGYLSLDRKGRLYDGTVERLMPRAWSFAARSARLAAASSVLPAVTDPNHAAALTGSWSGTLGIFSVLRHFVGDDADGRPVLANNSRDMLRWGYDGQRVRSVFDVNKDPASGGSPSTFHAIVTGKNWIAELFRDEAIDLVVHGKDYPDYVPRPQPYRLGDPPSDGDAELDREGTSLGPWGIKHLFSLEAGLIGSQPSTFPEDRWIAEAAARVVQADDPDVLYVNLASSDEAQHVFGAADRPEEWSDRGTPNILWDDESVYNRKGNRDPVLDVVHEADLDFGLLLDVLQARQALDRSFVTLLSDHGLKTAMDTSSPPLDPGAVLLEGGLLESDVERMVNRGELADFRFSDPAKAAVAEALLESYEVFDPVEQEMVNPFIVINRHEMDGGADGAGRAFIADGVLGNRKGELYSEWNIDAPAAGGKILWPDLFLYTRRHFRTKISTRVSSSGDGVPLHGIHGGPGTTNVLLLASGPGIRPGVYTAPASLADIAPTLYHLLGVAAPANVDGRVLDEILER